MKIKFSKDYETATHHFRAGREYEVAEYIGEAATAAGCVDVGDEASKPEPTPEPVADSVSEVEPLEERKAVVPKPTRRTKRGK